MLLVGFAAKNQSFLPRVIVRPGDTGNVVYMIKTTDELSVIISSTILSNLVYPGIVLLFGKTVHYLGPEILEALDLGGGR